MLTKKGDSKKFILILLIFILNLNFINAADSFDPKNPDTWITNINDFSKTLNENPAEINKVWNTISSEQRKYYSGEIINQISKANFQIKSMNLFSLLTGNTNDAKYVDIETFVGFENPKISWNKNKVITDGKVSLSLERIPNGITEIRYENNNFVLKYKDGGELVLGEGSTNENGEIIGLQKMIDSGIIKLNNAGQGKSIKIQNGELVASGGATIDIGKNKLTKISGLNNPNLKWNNNILGNGKAFLDFESLPNGISEIYYQETKVGENNIGEFVLKNADGRTLTIRGGTNEQGKLISSVGDGKISLNDITLIFDDKEKSGNIIISEKIDGDGKTIGHNIELGLGTKLTYNGKIFSDAGGPMNVEIISNNRFKITRGEITMEDGTLIGSYSTSLETEVIFDNSDTTGLARYIKIDNSNKLIKASGNDYRINLKSSDYKEIHGIGDNIEILNDKFKLVYDNNGVKLYRIGNDQTNFDDLKIYVGNGKVKVADIINVDKPKTEEIKPPVEAKPIVPPKTKIEVKPTNAPETRVCIGKSCTYGWGGLSGVVLKDMPYEWEATGVTTTYISESSSTVPQSQFKEFIELAKKNGWSGQTLQNEASTFFNDVQSVTIVRKTDGLTFDEIKPSLLETIDKLGLNGNDLRTAQDTISKVEANLPTFEYKGRWSTKSKTGVPPGTKIFTSVHNTGDEKTSYGTFKMVFPQGSAYEFKINGNNFDKIKQENFRNYPNMMSEIKKALGQYDLQREIDNSLNK